MASFWRDTLRLTWRYAIVAACALPVGIVYAVTGGDQSRWAVPLLVAGLGGAALAWWLTEPHPATGTQLARRAAIHAGGGTTTAGPDAQFVHYLRFVETTRRTTYGKVVLEPGDAFQFTVKVWTAAGVLGSTEVPIEWSDLVRYPVAPLAVSSTNAHSASVYVQRIAPILPYIHA
jgi:hypothetical protein